MSVEMTGNVAPEGDVGINYAPSPPPRSLLPSFPEISVLTIFGLDLNSIFHRNLSFTHSLNQSVSQSVNR